MNSYLFAEKIPEKHELRNIYSNLTAQLLLNRNITTLATAEDFLHPKFKNNHDPFKLYNMGKSIERFYTAIQNNERITIYADYDADGIPGSIVLANLLEKIKYNNFDIYIPHRHDEGYGIHIDALEGILNAGTSLVVTIDVGITGHDAALWSLENGIDMIITDHHLPLERASGGHDIPKSFSVINPKQELCHYPDPMLCGCGVIFKFVQAFIQKHGLEYNIPVGWEKWLLDMVGISTISDMVPLRNENRIFAYFGMKVIEKIATEKNRRIGLKKLMWDAGIQAKYMTEEDISFSITPKINAASRMSHPEDAVAVFMAHNEIEATESVAHLVLLNNERKKLVAKTMKEAEAMLDEREISSVVVIGKDTWQAGILGLVASKIVEKYKKPAFVWSLEGDTIKGSCRSLDGLHLVNIMQHAESKTFLGFGGHAGAGGFSADKNEIGNMQSRLEKALVKFTADNSELEKDTLKIDMELSPDAITVGNYLEMRKLAPFGMENPKPLFVFKNILIDSANTFGKEKNHLEISFKNSFNKTIRAISFFKVPTDFKKLKEGSACDLVAHIEYSVFMGKHELRLKIVDVL